MDIQVGDRVICRGRVSCETIEMLVADNEDVNNIQKDIQENRLEILKIERPKYEVVEEKKELLTEQEKEFLKLYMQFTNIITNTIYKKDGFINFIGYTVELALYKGFDKLIENKLYTLKELGLEEN